MSETIPSCPDSAVFFGMLGATSALVFSCIGSAYGTAKAGVGISHLGIMNHKLIIKGMLPVILAGALGIYGLIVSIIIVTTGIKAPYSSYRGFAHMAAGISTGFCSLAAGMAIGIAGDSGVRAFGKQEKVYIGMVLILIFSEALGIYGLIVGIIASSINLGPKCQ
eukprot:GEZU01042484.1.p1 GENE.GEZU01042484.1~~GEZU01042484.1.p1  ORF type:complete len:191 (+),score=51.87 GEZU01042484.1:80-574(+)